MKALLISAAVLLLANFLVLLVFVHSVDCRRRRREKKMAVLYKITRGRGV
jgi:hypothetical protein